MLSCGGSGLQMRRQPTSTQPLSLHLGYLVTGGWSNRMVNEKGWMKMAEILYPDGTSKEIHPANGDHFEIEELMQIVEGQIQMIPLPDGRIMTFNEDGGPDAEAGSAGLPPNEQATA